MLQCSWAMAVGNSTKSRRNTKNTPRERNIVMIYGISIKILPLKFITLSMLSDISSQKIECGCGYYILSEWCCFPCVAVLCALNTGAHKNIFWTISIKLFTNRASLSWFWFLWVWKIMVAIAMPLNCYENNFKGSIIIIMRHRARVWGARENEKKKIQQTNGNSNKYYILLNTEINWRIEGKYT